MNRVTLGVAFSLLGGCAPSAPIVPNDLASSGAYQWAADLQAERRSVAAQACDAARMQVAELASVETVSSDHGCYAGSLQTVPNPYSKTPTRTFHDGAYRMNDRLKGWRTFRGRFVFFHSSPAATGTYVMVGKRIDADGSEESGIFVGEGSSTDIFSFLQADQEYIDHVEAEHSEEVATFRETQRRLAERQQRIACERQKLIAERERREASEGGFSFLDALLFVGGAAAIANNDLGLNRKFNIARKVTRSMFGDDSQQPAQQQNGSRNPATSSANASNPCGTL